MPPVREGGTLSATPARDPGRLRASGTAACVRAGSPVPSDGGGGGSLSVPRVSSASATSSAEASISSPRSA